MEYSESTIALKEKLLVAGIDEITRHGVTDFSLRRVAAACGASCAAPYKHFKNKEHFIEEIYKYVEKRWELLAAQIIKSIEDPRQRIAELCIANVRFTVANPIYDSGMSASDKIIQAQIKALCGENNLPDAESRQFGITVLLAGTAALIENGKLDNTPHTLSLLRTRIMAELI